jgi:hypothetical protein
VNDDHSAVFKYYQAWHSKIVGGLRRCNRGNRSVPVIKRLSANKVDSIWPTEPATAEINLPEKGKACFKRAQNVGWIEPDSVFEAPRL